MVGQDGIARLTDFGVAKAETRLSSTREGQFKGKLAYMSPEHASEGITDQRSDLFAMATILWECLTGHRLFRAENHAATLNKVCLEPIPLLSSVHPELAPFDSILEKGLARNPDERYQSASDFVEAIEAKASEIGGLGNKRAVGGLVKELAVEKIENDRELIRKGVEAVKIRSVTGTAPPSAEQPPPVPAPQTGAAAEVAAAQAPFPPPATPQPVAPGYVEDAASYPRAPAGMERGKLVWVVGGIAVAVALGAGIAAILLGDDETEGITTSPLVPTEAAGQQPVSVPTTPASAPTAPAQTAGPQPGVSGTGEAVAEDETEAAPEKEVEGRESAKKEPREKSSAKRKARRTTPRTEPRKEAASSTSSDTSESEGRRERRRRTPPARKKVDDIFDNPYR
jgi:serine/threonine-protein kinase